MTRLNEHTDAVTALAADANYLFSGSDDLTIRIWNLANMLEPYVALLCTWVRTAFILGCRCQILLECVPRRAQELHTRIDRGSGLVLPHLVRV